jgi:hypothetical protein
MNRFDLEQLILRAWSTSEDLDLVSWKMMDCEEKPSEDEIANMLLALKTIHELRMNKLWQCFEKLIQNKKL